MNAEAPDDWVEAFRMAYDLISELAVEARRTNEAVLVRMDVLQDDLTTAKGMLLDLHSDVAAQVPTYDAQIARLHVALRRVEMVLERVSVRLDAVAALTVPTGGVAMGEELPLDR